MVFDTFVCFASENSHSIEVSRHNNYCSECTNQVEDLFASYVLVLRCSLVACCDSRTQTQAIVNHLPLEAIC